MPWLLGLLLVAGVVLAARHFTEARDFALMAEHAQPRWLALAVALQLSTYAAQGQVFRLVAHAGRSRLGLVTACRLGLIKLLVDQVLPSAGLSGTVVLAGGLGRRGMPRATVAAGIVVDLASYYAAFVLCLAAAVGLAALRGEAHAVLLIPAALFVLFAAVLSAFVLAASGKGPARPLPRALARMGLVRKALDFVRDADPRLARSPRLLALASLWQLCIFLCDAATVWVLIHSLGFHAGEGGVFASFMLSSLLRTLGFMPGGLGTFEAASVVTLRLAGVPVAVALAATLLFRGLSFWLPMVPGLWLWRREQRGGA